ncbi:MFS transporter [Alcanivorax marinus]|uniref:MFS transporter n=1 Tax=Alloalcanivorax marinus TaxID=1177169 RepID=A0A9Q3UMH2_9GAMM|nr:MFS transporter [Alloalcanivorax marinus]MCC4308092.1 MFS transporter [Alloalcanivorax marinus]
MFSSPLAARLQRRGVHYAWVIAGVTFMTMLSASAALGMPGAFLRPLGDEFGWNTEQISTALALRFVLFGLMAPFSAMLIERFGLRRIMTSALLLVAAGLALSTQMTRLWHLVLLWGVVLGLGSGLIALVLGAVVANRWFERHRGLVIGLLTASVATGQLLFLPLATWLIEQAGWRWALMPVALCCATVAGLVWLLVRDHPHQLGLRPFGAPDDGTPVGAPPASAPMSFLEPLRLLRGALRNRVFWVLFGTFFICGLSTNGLIQTHFIAFCGDFGLSPLPAASVLALMGAFDLVGTILSGWLSDRFDNRKLLCWYYGLRGLSLFWLPFSDFTLYGLSLFALFYGLDWIATVPPTVKLAGHAFGPQRAGMLFGWIFAGHQLGGALAAYGAGLSRTLLLTYTPAFLAAGAACLLAAAAVFLIRKPAGPAVA